MTIPYTSYTYLVPPRANNAVPPGSLPDYQARGWYAQVKKNGTNTVIFVPPERKAVTAMTRHGTEHKAWKFTPESRRFFEKLPGRGWIVLNAELMHSKVRGLRDTHYIHDVLVLDGEWLLGKPYAWRYEQLKSMCVTAVGQPDVHPEKYVLDPNTWLARNIRTPIGKYWAALVAEPVAPGSIPENEGVVMKDPNGVLGARGEGGWMVKCRRIQKAYAF